MGDVIEFPNGKELPPKDPSLDTHFCDALNEALMYEPRDGVLVFEDENGDLRVIYGGKCGVEALKDMLAVALSAMDSEDYEHGGDEEY